LRAGYNTAVIDFSGARNLPSRYTAGSQRWHCFLLCSEVYLFMYKVHEVYLSYYCSNYLKII